MDRSRFIRTASRSLLAAGITLVASSMSLHAKPKDQVPLKPYPDSQIRFQNPDATVPALLPDLTVQIKKVTCFDGHVAVKLRLQNLQNGNIGITAPFVTQVKVGGQSATLPSGASQGNPWYNGQEKGANLFPGYGTFKVSALIDSTNLVVEANPNNNLAPSAQNSFDANPDPLYITCDKPPSSQKSQPAETQDERVMQRGERSLKLRRNIRAQPVPR